MTWDSAQREWERFLAKVQEAKDGLHCSWHGAWFRGHSDSDQYRLVPALFRIPDRRDPDFRAEVEALEKKKEEFPRRFGELVGQKAALKNRHNRARESKNIDEAKKALEQLEEVNRLIRLNKSALSEICRNLQGHQLLHAGERDAFLEYSFRAGANDRSSWETLAEMQHYGIPTRLLDWTEILAVALYFALSEYRKKLFSEWNVEELSNDGRFRNINRNRDFRIPAGLAVPSVWIINPYLVSRDATKRTRVWDLTSPEYDYFANFIAKKSWHFEKPIPVYSPWRNTRLAAQQGMFTVSGYSKEPLDKIFSKRVAREVRLDPAAAVYGVRHLLDFCGIDHFTLFRDLDTLGNRIRGEYL
ncbi:MAG: FRG domain-containing protein [Thermoanaerobaculia bacterium]